MVRRTSFALILLVVFASAATGVQVQASTECERWISQYKNELAHSELVKRAAAAKRRLHHYVHRQTLALRTNVRPKGPVRVLPARLQRPKMTREETLRQLEFACGELPIDPVELKHDVGYEPKPVPSGSMVSGESEVGPFAMLETPPSGSPETGAPAAPGFSPGAGGFPGGGGSGTGGKSNPGNPTGSNPGNPGSPAGTPPAVVPEPGSLVLLATGLAGMAGMVRRRIVSAAV